jgi:hypothetical protein
MPPKDGWINWKNVITAVACSAALGLASWLWLNASRVYAEHKEVVAFERTHAEEEQAQKAIARQQSVLLEQIAKDVTQIKQNSMTVFGITRLASGDGTFVMVNTTGAAAQYMLQKRCRVTNLQNTLLLSVVVDITGQFRNENESLVLLISKKAASLLGTDSGAMRVRIEPISEK